MKLPKESEAQSSVPSMYSLPKNMAVVRANISNEKMRVAIRIDGPMRSRAAGEA